MARAKSKRSIEDKVVSSKRVPSRVRKPQSEIWSCQVNGCNKQFARETDLKRHLNTTKLHMPPNTQPIMCPQCDSTFTRTDALKRHQKSRHNGIIIPVGSIRSSGSGDNVNLGGEGSGTSTPRSGTISKRNKASASTPEAVPVPTTKTQPDAPGPSGTHSYFKQTIINPIFVPPYTPNGVIDTSVYNPHQLPMSTSRFHAWVPNPQWTPDMQQAYQPPSTPAAYAGPSHAVYYAPGAYYRTPQGQPVNPIHTMPPGIVPVQPGPPARSQASGDTTSDNSNTPADAVADINANIDPSLQASSITPEKSEANAEEESVDENGTTTDAFADSGLSPDVQIALQAVVLAIDSGSASVIAQSSRIQPSSDKSDLAEIPDNANGEPSAPSNQQASKPVSVNENGLSRATNQDGMNLDDADADADADADGEAVSDVDDDRNEQITLFQNKSEPSPLPDGIKDLINEYKDSLSYATPS